MKIIHYEKTGYNAFNSNGYNLLTITCRIALRSPVRCFLSINILLSFQLLPLMLIKDDLKCSLILTIMFCFFKNDFVKSVQVL